MSSNPFAPLMAGGASIQTNQQGGRNARSGRARSGGIVGGALRKAGLADEDSGMRDASGLGRRRIGVNQAGRNDGKSLSARLGESSSSAPDGYRARDRANPLASRGRPRASHDPSVSGTAFGIRGAANRGNINGNGPIPMADLLRGSNTAKGKGRVPGGGGHGAGYHQASNYTPQPLTGKTIAALKKFLQARWVAEAHFMNLEAMSTDPSLIEEGVKTPGTQGAHRDVGSVMWKLCNEMFPSVMTVSLAKNDLKSLLPVASLADFLPDLKNLSLENNDIKWVRDLSFHSSKVRSMQVKFNALQELILNGNPVHDNAVAAGNEEGYRGEVLARFPTLKMLDRVAVSPKESNFASLPGSNKGKDSTGAARGAGDAGVEVRDFPLAIRNKGFADQEANNIIPAFLSKFFELYDSDRESLRAVYSPNATFTIVTSSNVPPRARLAGYAHTLPRQRDLNWKGYKEVASHNIMTMGVRSPSRGFPTGPGAIISVISKLARTRHPLTDASKFVVDGWVIDNAIVGANIGSTKPDALLFISVQGEFAELPSLGVRSFSRCFVVAPVIPGSQAANLGWPCVIISDQFTVRQYAGIDAWDPNFKPKSDTTPTLNGASTSSTTPNKINLDNLPNHLKNITPAAGLTPDQHLLSLQLAAQTNLTYPFAIQCLGDNGWNPELALTNFKSLKAAGSIPAEAFVVAM